MSVGALLIIKHLSYPILMAYTVVVSIHLSQESMESAPGFRDRLFFKGEGALGI